MTATNKFIAELEDRIDDLEGDVEGYKEDILALEGRNGELEDALQIAEKAERERDEWRESSGLFEAGCFGNQKRAEKAERERDRWRQCADSADNLVRAIGRAMGVQPDTDLVIAARKLQDRAERLERARDQYHDDVLILTERLRIAEADRDLYLEDSNQLGEQVNTALKDWAEEKASRDTWMQRCFQARHELQEMRNALRTLAGER